jgi:hypothetical protein
MRCFIGTTFLQASVVLTFTVFMPTANAQPYFTLDPATGNYKSIYDKQDGSGTANGVFIPASKFIAPSARSVFSLSGVDTMVYRYTVANAGTAVNPIIGIYFDGIVTRPLIGEIPEVPNETIAQMIASYTAQSNAMPNVVLAPPAWRGSIDRHITGPDSASLISWSGGGILPGVEISGLGFSSLDLPGLAQLVATGTYDEIWSDADGPGDDEIYQHELSKISDATDPTVNAAAPMIAVPTPYDAAVTLENIQTHAHTWITKQLLNATFSTQLDTSFQAAIAAYRANQPQTAIIQLQTMRTLIKQQQPDADKNDVTPTINLPAPPALIDLLAARILYFDLGYVMQR